MRRGAVFLSFLDTYVRIRGARGDREPSSARSAFERAGHGKCEPFYCNFALDAGYFSRRGIEAVMLGPGEVDQFHSSEEHVLVSDLVAMSEVYCELIHACL